MKNKYGRYFDPDIVVCEENNPFKHMNNKKFREDNCETCKAKCERTDS